MSLTLLSRSSRAESSTAPTSPPASRVGRRWWRDGRVMGGILIVVVSVLVGARLMATGDDTVAVWQVNRDVSAGAVLGPDDVSAVSVPSSASAAYAPANGLPADRLARDLQAGELVPVAIDAAKPDVRWVTVPVEPLHAPPDLLAGERVDVWATNADDLAGVVPPASCYRERWCLRSRATPWDSVASTASCWRWIRRWPVTCSRPCAPARSTLSACPWTPIKVR